MDKDGPTIADNFYEDIYIYISRSRRKTVPWIWHHEVCTYVSVKKLSSQNVSFCRWVSFIHMGQWDGGALLYDIFTTSLAFYKLLAKRV